MTEQKRRPRGRPRPQETIERDRRVLEQLRAHGPQSRNDLADALGESRSLVWLSLNRLRNDGLVAICTATENAAVWTVEVDAPCP